MEHFKVRLLGCAGAYVCKLTSVTFRGRGLSANVAAQM